MPKIVSVQKMIAIEQAQVPLGISLDQLMRTAGAELARVIVEFSAATHISKKAVALVGSGNNGGDALVAITNLASNGWQCSAFLVGERKQDDILITEAVSTGCKIYPINSEVQGIFAGFPVVIDGILGTGFKLPLRESLTAAMANIGAAIEESGCQVFAVDCPSGVDCDSGEAADAAIPSEVTVCMAAVKQGLLKTPAAELAGRITVVDIGITADNPEWQSAKDEVIDAERLQDLLPERGPHAHKGSFGKILVCGGCAEYPGAPALSAMGAYSVGAGLVRLAAPEITQLAFAGQLPEAVWARMPTENGYLCADGNPNFEKFLIGQNAVVFGPGMGQSASVAEFVSDALDVFSSAAFITQGTRVVFDADGLRHLAKIENWYQRIPAGSIITPHPGEFEAISTEFSFYSADRSTKAKAAAAIWNCVVVLKGANTIVAAPDGRSAMIPIATSALAKAGTGDVLSGMIAGMIAQGLDSFEAAIAGAGLHAMAGLAASADQNNDRSVMASDLRYYIGDVLISLRESACTPGLLGI